MRFKQKIAAVVLLVLSVSLSAGAENRFFETMPDMPLMPGLEESVSGTAVFDKPEGRIVEAVAFMRGVERQKAVDFYNRILPEFGWKRMPKDGHFEREEEALFLSFNKQDGDEILTFLIVPQGDGGLKKGR